ncbi:MAG: LysE family translocator [Dehalobacterium sp.]
MINVAFWASFLLAAILINISPGPELIYVITRTVTYGRKDGFYSALGAGSGSMVHVVMVAFGLSLILSRSLVAFYIIKILGAGYLIYLGIKAFLSKDEEAVSFKGDVERTDTPFDSFRKGVLVGLLNPKSIIFFMAFLPQFVRADAGAFCTQIVILGVLTIIMGILFEILVILLTNRIREVLFKDKLVSKFINKVMGSVLILLGLRLAFISHSDR